MKAGSRRRSQFSWEARATGSVLKITFGGDLDMAVFDECKAGLAQPLIGPERIVLVDMSDVTFIDSTGLRLLIHLKQTTESAGKQLLLGPVAQIVVNALDAAGATAWFEYLDGQRPVV